MKSSSAEFKLLYVVAGGWVTGIWLNSTVYLTGWLCESLLKVGRCVAKESLKLFSVKLGVPECSAHELFVSDFHHSEIWGVLQRSVL